MTNQTQPASGQAEEEILGMVMIDQSILDDTILQPEDFYYQQNRIVWQALQTMHANNEYIDVVGLTEHLRQNGQLEKIGGMPQIAGLMEISGVSSMYEASQKVIKERKQQRDIIDAAGKAMTDAYNLQTPDEIISNLDSFVTTATPGVSHDYEMALASAARYATGEALVKTGIEILDNAIGGFTRNDFTVIGARTSTGKSAFIHRIADNIALAEEGPVTIFTPDQPIPEVLAMQAARECGTPLSHFRHGIATDEQKEAYVNAVQNLKSGFLQRLDFRPGLLTIKHFQTEAVRAIRNGSTAIIVDTINRLSGPHDKKHALIAEFGSLAKSLAAEYDIPIIGLAQVRRELDWEDRDPTRADLADAPGSLANDANMILLLNRTQADRHEGRMQVIIDKAKADRAGHYVNILWDDDFVMPHNGKGVTEVTAHLGQASMQL